MLFVIVANGLNRMIERAKEEDMLCGLPGSPNLEFTKLQYVDDTLIFNRCDLRLAIILKCILSYFELWSGLIINYHKSSMIPLNGHPFISKFILAIFGCKQESLPINYMGVLLDKGRLSRRECFLLIDRVERKLDS